MSWKNLSKELKKSEIFGGNAILCMIRENVYFCATSQYIC